MSTQPDPLQLNAFVDGELELTRQLEIEAQAAADPAVRAQLERLRATRASVRASADYHAAPPALRQRVRALLDEEEPEPAVTSFMAPPRWRIALPSFAAGAAVCALVVAAVQLSWLPQEQVQRIQDEVLASHARAVVADRLVDVASSDHHQVKPWLSARLDFSPPVDPPPGSQLLGARIDYVAGRPVAVLVLRHGAHTVDSFVWPARGADEPLVLSQERGFQMARWSAHGMRHWVVSDLSAQEFEGLVRSIRAAD